jgi:hypothetical protein
MSRAGSYSFHLQCLKKTYTLPILENKNMNKNKISQNQSPTTPSLYASSFQTVAIGGSE